MFHFRKDSEPSQLKALIDVHTRELINNNYDSDEYARRVDQLSKLCKMQETISPTRRVSADTLAIIGANLLGILVIVGYEHMHTITSKAIGFVVKPK
jgi:hypothetical protein